MYHGDVVPGFPRHPHRGFETVTVVRKGLVDHSDSLGATARYGQGDVQWLTTGAGIQHAEMFPLVDTAGGNPLELFQIWLNLPAKHKMVAPYFTMFWADQVPGRELLDDRGKKAWISTVAGRYPGATEPPPPPPDSWASQPDSDVVIWTVKLDPGATARLPPCRPGTNRDVYFFRGDTLQLNGEALAGDSGASVRPDVPLNVQGGDAMCELLILQGAPIGEPVAQHGPFVMNTRSELVRAMDDYRQTQFGGWRWGKDDPVHPRTEQRFAIYPDGRRDDPKAG